MKIYVSYNNADWINFASFENEATDGQNFTFTWDAAVDKFSNEYGDDAGYAYIPVYPASNLTYRQAATPFISMK